ncbi:MAG: DapH/DapD/GlmU-related protein [Ruminococcus sp.]|nr:DapH/DapD/GlmU-related protein [Ruminococcus sp.]
MMMNTFGNKVKIYDGAVLRNSIISDNVTIGTDAFVSDSRLGEHVIVERRGMVFDSIFGAYSYIGWNTTVRKATIGRFTSISWNCSIGGVNHDIDRVSLSPFFVSEKQYKSYNKPVNIGNDVWIGANACLARGVEIGDGAIIGAGSIITKDVNPYSIVVGVNQLLRKRFSDEIINRLLEIKWWNYPLNIIEKCHGIISKPADMDVLDRSESILIRN